MEENRNVIFKTLRLTALFLSVFLALMFVLISGKVLTFQFMGSASVWSVQLLLVSFVILAAYPAALVFKKFRPLAFIASVVGFFALVFLSLKPLISPLDLWLKIPSLTLILLFLKHAFLPLFGLFAIIFSIKKDKEAAQITALGVLLCLILYPFMYEKSITLTQSLMLCNLAYGAAVLLNIALLFDTEEESTKEELPKTHAEILKPLGLGALTGALLAGYTNHLTFNLAPIPAVWAFALLAFGAGAYLAYTKETWAQRRHALVAVWISLLMVVIFRMRVFAYLENPCLNTILVLFSLFAFSWLLWGEVLIEKTKNKSFWGLIVLGVIAGMLFQNALIPLIFKVYIDYVVLNFILYSFAFFIFCISFVRGKNFGEDVLKKSLLTLSLSIIVIFAFFIHQGTAFIELRTRNFWGLNSVEINRVNGTKEFYANQGLRSLQTYGHRTLTYTINPLGYYGLNSGFYYVYTGMKNWETTKNRPLLVAKIGMEGGGINGYLNESDKVIYYDANPQAKDLADKFTYMTLTKGEAEFKAGNPRVNLGNEKAKFDIIFIDLAAQQGDSAYLITKEALDLYKSKLKKDGIIIFNTTSKNFNYRKVLTKYTQDNNLKHSYFVTRYDKQYTDNLDNTSFIIFGDKNKIYKRFENFLSVEKGVESFSSADKVKTMRREFNDNNSSILPLFRFAVK